MDVRKIKDLLHAWRPGQDVPPEVSQAREIASSDPELSAWLDNERAFDQAFADKLRAVRPPSDLLARIMAAHDSNAAKVIPFPISEPPRAESGRSRMIRYAVSIAASLAIVGGIFIFATHSGGSDDDLDSFVSATVLRAMSDSASMRNASGLENVARGLQSDFAPVPGSMPEALAKFQPAKYGVIHTQRGNMSQIGFSGNDAYRLIVVERRCLGNCSKKLTKPVMFDLGDKLAVSWTRGSQVFILVGDRSGENVIRTVVQPKTGTSL
jgi:hypothetical protein